MGAVPALCALSTRFCAESPRPAGAKHPPAVVRLETRADAGLESSGERRGVALSSRPHDPEPHRFP